MKANLRLVNSLLDPSFAENTSRNTSLVVYFQDRSISCLIKNPDINTFIGYERYEAEDSFSDMGKEKLFAIINNLFSQEHLHPEKNVATRIVCETRQYTLLPNSLKGKETDRQLLSFNYHSGQQLSIHSNPAGGGQVRIVFYLLKALSDIINRVFSFPVIYHHTTVLAETGLLVSKTKNLENPVFVNSGATGIDILIIKEGSVQYLNSFKCQGPEDSVYYLLFVMEQLKVNPELTPVYFSGADSSDSQLYRLLSRYVRNVELLARNGSATYRNFFLQVPESIEIPLFNAELCE